MPRYFFHVYSDGLTQDEEGAELADAHSAREHAMEAIRSLVCDQIVNGYLNLEDRIEITQGDMLVCAVSFREAFEIHGVPERSARPAG